MKMSQDINDGHHILLSICIPTFNRAQMLESALYALAPQISSYSRLVELIVSDNCSTDNTREIVERSRTWGPIRYYCNNSNEGAARNILHLTGELARGEYAWILGDDDLVRPGAIAKLVSVLSAYPEIDYVFINGSAGNSERRKTLNRRVIFADFPEILPSKGNSLIDRYIETWDELIDPSVDDVYLGALMCSVFRLSCWNSYSLEIPTNDILFTSLENTYPHSVILAHTMVGRKAFYIGYPYVIIFYGHQEWLGYIPVIGTVRLHELLDLYRQCGVERKRVEHCRSHLLRSSADSLRAIIFNTSTLGRDSFSLSKFIWRSRYHPLQLMLLFITLGMKYVKSLLPRPLIVLVKNTLRNIRLFILYHNAA